MTSHVNEIVLDTLKKHNSNFKTIYIKNNIIYFNDEALNLIRFSLHSLFDSYQFKLDCKKMEDSEFFKVIKINSMIENHSLYKIISNEIFFDKVNNNQDDESIDVYLSFMENVYKYQSFLNKENFNKYQEYDRFVKSLISSDKELNDLQAKIINHYKNINKNQVILSLVKTNDENEGGVTYKYTNPNGFISILTILTTTISVGLGIAYLLISRL